MMGAVNMPTLATMQAATPKCPYNGPPIVRVKDGKVQKPPVGEKGRPCGRMMKWDHERCLWLCPAHGGTMTAEALVQMQAA